MRKLAITLTALLFVTAAAAQGTPSFPHVVEGQVQFNEEPYTGAIEARGGGEVLDSTRVESGSFGEDTDPLLVSGFDGSTIEFYVDGINAEDQSLEFESGATDSVDLDISISDDQPAKVSNVVKPENGNVQVNVPDAVNENRNAGVQRVSIDVSDDVESTEVNVTVSDSYVQESDVDENDLPDGTSANGFVSVDTSVGNDRIESAEVDISLSRDSIDDPENVVVFHFEDGEQVGRLNPEYLDDRSEDTDQYFYSFETDSFSTFVAASDNEDPDAEIDVSDSNVEPGEDITFDASQSSDNVEIESYEWDFDDGSTDTGELVQHSYDDEGSYDATLTVTDEAGNTDTATEQIDVEEESSSGSSYDPSPTVSDDNSDENTDETGQQEQQTEDPEENITEEPDQPENDTGQQEQSQEESQQDDEADQSQQPATGQFFGSPGSFAAVATLVALLIGVLQYAGRIDLISAVSGLRSNAEQEAEEAWQGFS